MLKSTQYLFENKYSDNRIKTDIIGVKRLFIHKDFIKFGHENDISKKFIKNFINELLNNEFSWVSLGNNIYKLRLANPNNNKGSSSGFRLIIFYKPNDKLFLIKAFSKIGKDNKENLDSKEMKFLKNLSDDFYDPFSIVIDSCISNKTLTEIKI